jgi:hypothetical protein
MSYTFLQEQGEESSADTFSDIPQYVLLRLNLIADESCSNGNEMESCQSSQYGMMLQHLTATRGEEKSMSSAGVFPVKTSQQQEKEPGSQENEAVSGQKWPESLAKYDPNTHSWRTHQCLLFEDLTECLAIFPKWGMMHDGELWELTMSAHLIEENESGLQPDGINFFHTPNTTGLDGGSSSRKALKKRQGMIWPTPLSCSAMAATITPDSVWNENRFQNLETIVGRSMWPTPCASDNRDRGHIGMPVIQRRKEKGKQIGLGQSVSDTSGALNPDWVEWLMGWPIGWTDLKPLEMVRFQSWRQQHSDFFQNH